MRIHEVLDACVEYVAYEGILGSDMLSLQQYLTKRDSSLDATSFAYLYTLLCQHPSIRIAISTYPLPSADKSVQPGSAPLPDDYSPPDETLALDMGEMFRQGKRGRELAFHFAGEEHKTSKEAVAVKRAEQERIRLEKLQYEGVEVKKKGKGKRADVEQIKDADGTVLFTFLDEDDGALGGDPVDTLDLAGLAEKWGTRLRIRCTDDEIYFRLTGSHQKIPKLSLPVMHALQLAARSRARGITAIELGPMIGASQGSTYYYMKVLIEQGLCTKVPTVIHGSTTNLLIYHPFIELNETYRAIKNLGPVPGPTAQVEIVEEDDNDPAIDATGGTGASGFNFRPMSEAEFLIGHIVKERLIQLLDHPALQNHLLKARNLHNLIGWITPTSIRQSRAMPRHIRSLVEQGIVERIEVGPKRIDCLRLTKYNPDYTGPPEPAKIEEVDSDAVITYSPHDFSETYRQVGGIAMNRTYERQIIDIIVASGTAGVTYHRSLEFFLMRAEDSWYTPQLRPTALCSVMESFSKERRLRVFVVPTYRTFMVENNQTPDDATHPPLTDEAGRWASLSTRHFAADTQDFWRRAERLAEGNEKSGKARLDKVLSGKPVKVRRDIGMKRPRASSGKAILPSKKRARSVTGSEGESEGQGQGEGQGEGRPGEERVNKRPLKFYGNKAQLRGRPRKYVHVVDEEGVVKRMIVGQLLPHPDLPPVLIWVASVKKLVPASAEYSGLGKPEPVTAEQLKAGHSPKYYDKFPKHYNKSKMKGKPRKRQKVAEDGDEEDELDEDEEVDVDMGLKSGQADGEEDEVAETDADGEEVEVVKKSRGRPRKSDAAPTVKRSKRISAVQAAAVSPAPDGDAYSSTPPALPDGIDPSVIDPSLRDPLTERPDLNHTPEVSPEVSPVASARVQTPAEPTPLPAIADQAEIDIDPTTQRGLLETTPMSGDGSHVDFELPIEILDAAIAIKPVEPVKNPRKRAKKDTAVDEPASADLPADSTDGKKPKRKYRKKATKPDQTPLPTPEAVPQAQPSASPAPPPIAAAPIPSLPLPADPSPTPQTSVPLPAPGPQRKSTAARVDLGLIRRNNEIIETLRTNGGVLNEIRLVNAHCEWTHRVAGTDAPHAPLVAYRMDRRIFRHSLPILEAEGRIKQTNCSVPTNTGRWIQQQVCWLSETPRIEIDAYISSLAESTISSQLLMPKRGKRTQIEDQAFSEVKMAGGLSVPGSSRATVMKHALRDDTPATIRRNALLQQSGVPAALLGYISGRWARARHFFESLVGALAEATPSRITSSPYIFALPLIFEDIPVGVFYECIHTTTYDEQLEEWLSIPGNRALRLRDVPPDLRPGSGGFAGATHKAKYRTILTTLCQLGLLSPLNPAAPDVADITIPTATDPIHFKIAERVGQATHFVVHHHAPVYHIAATPSGLLGILPISTPAERAAFWCAVQNACLAADINVLPQLNCDAPIGLPLTARISERLELEIEIVRMLRSPKRWRNDTRLLDEQREAVDRQIDWRRGMVKITSDEDLEAFAYTNALSVEHAREELSRRAAQAKARVARVAQKQAESVKSLRESRAKNQRSLREKLAEIRLAAKRQWEARISKAAEAVDIPCTAEVVSFVTRHTLSVPNRANLSDSAIESAVKLSLRVQAVKAATGEKVEEKRDIWDRQTMVISGLRRRHLWNVSEDDLLLDAEAIIRARSRGRIRGRAAVTQIFPDVGHQTLSSRFKKIVGRPGKQQYFDRLEEAWYDLWINNRGTAELVDDDPDNTTAYDLKHHIEYLRANLNKQELRLGAQKSENIVKTADLPADYVALIRNHDWRYPKSMQINTLQSLTDKEVSEEAKMAGYLALPLRDVPREAGHSALDRQRGKIRACLKMVVSTPIETYDPVSGKDFLSQFPPEQRGQGVNALVEDRIFVKNHTTAHTARGHSYSAYWVSASEGPVSDDLFSEAKAFNATLAAKGNEGIHWSSVCTGGDVASLLDMVSEDTVDIDFNPRDFRPVKYLRNTYNTRAIDDDAYEFDLSIKQTIATPVAKALLPVPSLGPHLSPWPKTDLPLDIYTTVRHVLDLVQCAGPDGITRSSLRQHTGYDEIILTAVFASLAAESPPRAFWAGYDTARLVYYKSWNDWLHFTKGRVLGPEILVRPRRWTDIRGDMIMEDWEKCVWNVLGHISHRPGMLVADLRVRVGIAMDRLELIEVVQYLEDSGAIRRAWVEGERGSVPPIEVMDEEDEGRVAYWSAKPWNIG